MEPGTMIMTCRNGREGGEVPLEDAPARRAVSGGGLLSLVGIVAVVALSPASAAAQPGPSTAAATAPGDAVLPPQVDRTMDDRGLVHLRWVRPAPLVVGQPVVLRWTVLNPGETPVELDADPCASVEEGARGSGALELGGVVVRCGEGGRTLEPGDSAWVELRGTLLSPPGRARAGDPFYRGEVELLPGDGTGVPLPEDRLAAPERVPLVVEVDLPSGHGVTAGRIEGLAGVVAGARGWILVPMHPSAARAQVVDAPWIHLGVGEGEPGGPLELRGCWTHPMHGEASCSPMRARIPPGPSGEVLAPEAPLHRFLRTLLALRDPTP